MPGLLTTTCLYGFAILACLNTTYSRDHEKQITNATIHLIMGQFPEHGPEFYKNQVESCRTALAEDPGHTDFRNDLAVALIKLGHYAQALKEFERIERDNPGLYRTQANLGVLFKKRHKETEHYRNMRWCLPPGSSPPPPPWPPGDLERAADHIRNSLQIRPEGHLGLGDYYLRMLNWRANLQSGQGPTKNFLGISYEEGPDAVSRAKIVNQKYLETLIKADRHFADTYLVLGDLLLARGEEQLALRAYWKARSLNHPTAVAKGRIDSLLKDWEQRASETEGYIFEPRWRINGRLSFEMEAAKKWVEQFHQVEVECLQDGGDIDFEVVKSEMARRGIEKPKFLHAGFVEGRMEKPGQTQFIFFLILGSLAGLSVIALGAIFTYRSIRFLARHRG